MACTHIVLIGQPRTNVRFALQTSLNSGIAGCARDQRQDRESVSPVGQQATSALRQSASLFDHLVGE
jgi:hypothetical protein